jgi:hypothetical protein
MFVLTAGYLAIEVPFSVHLAAVLGGAATAVDIHHIERFGRTLTGIAAAIAVIGMWYLPRMERLGVSRIRTCVSALVIGGIVASATYVSINAYADIRANWSSGQERKDAVVALLAKRALSETDIADKLGLDEHQRNGFIAAMPEIMGGDVMIAHSGRSAMQLAAYAGEDLKRTLGTVSSFKEAFFETHFDAGREAYDSYQSALAEVKAAYADLDGAAENAWETYTSRMDEAFPNGWPAGPGISRAMAWREVRYGADIPVPEDWNLRNKAVFVDAVKQKGAEAIFKAYATAVESQLGKGVRLKPGLSYEQFLAVPAVQKKIRAGLRGAEVPAGVVISPAMSDRSFEAALYSPQIDKAVSEMRAAISAPASDFDHGHLAEQGIDALKATTLPGLAIILSLVGAIVHIFKFTGYGLQIAGHLARIRPLQTAFVRHVAAASLMAFAASQYLGISMSSFSSPAMERISGNGIYGTVLVGTVMVQPQLAEISDGLSRIGAWDIASRNLPRPRPHAVHEAASEEVASLSPNVPIPAARPMN